MFEERDPFTSRWFFIGKPEPVDVTHNLTDIEPGASRETVRRVLRAQVPDYAQVLSCMWFDDVVELAWASKNNEAHTSRVVSFENHRRRVGKGSQMQLHKKRNDLPARPSRPKREKKEKDRK